MYKAKFCGFAIACLVGFLGLSPITAFAAETDTGSITLSDRDNDKHEKGSASKEKWKQAREKWNSLTDKQKDEVYSLMEKEMESKVKIMEKLSELGVLQKEDCDSFKAHMIEKYKDAKEDREFPYFRDKVRGRKK